MLSSARGMGRFCLRWPGLVVFAVVIGLSALLSTLVGTQHNAQSQELNPTDIWVDEGGNVEASTSTLTINEGETKSYSVRLTKQPHEGADDYWWVMIVVDGKRRGAGHYPDEENPIVSWSPSIGRTFDKGNWDRWKNISITAHQDDDDDDHTIIFSSELWDHDAYCPPDLHGGGTPLAKVTVHIIDDDGDLPSLSIEDTTVDEGDEAEFVVKLSRVSDETVTVDYRSVGGTAVEGTDYTAKTDTLTFAAGDTQKIIGVQTTHDELDEPNEEFSVTLSNPDRAVLSRGTGTGTITDDDNPTLSIADATPVVEGGTAEFVVEMSIPSTQSVTVNYQTRNGTAVAGQDFQTTSGILTFNPNTTQQTITVRTTDDSTDEVDETFTVTLSGPSGATLQDSSGTGTITDNDVAMLSISDATAAEGNPARFEVTLSPASARTVMVSYATSGGSATEGTDYTAKSSTLTFSPGDLNETIRVQTISDSMDEPDETFTVTLSSPTADATLADATAEGTITDDDLPTLSIANATAVEGETAQFVVTLSGPSTNSVMVSYRTASGTATEGTDYTGTSSSLSFSPSAAAQTQTISVLTIEDDLDEPNETFTLTLSGESGATVQTRTGTGTITDDDTGNGGGTDGGGTDNGGTDGGGTDNGGTDGGGTDGGGTDGGDNTNTGGDIDPNNGDGDEDERGDGGDSGLPRISIQDTTVEEGDYARFLVSLSPASDQRVTVRYRTEDGTARDGTDYRGVSRRLTFVPGDIQQSVLVWAHEDDIDEPNETFRVELSNPVGATIEDGSGTGTIVGEGELETLTPPALSISDETVVEGRTARFAVTLSPESAQTVTVNYRTASGTAVSGLDFDAASGTLTFDPYATRRTIVVQTREDRLDEPDETFTVRLSNPIGATIEDGSGTGTITDDDARSLERIHQELLPHLGRALAFTPVRCRIEQVFSDMARGWASPAAGPSLSFATPPQSFPTDPLEWEDRESGSPTLQQVLSNTSFLLPLIGADGSPTRFATWGCGDYRSLIGDGGIEAGAWDGEAFSVQVGADAIVGDNLIAGVSLSQSQGVLDFDGPSGDPLAGGGYDLRLTGVHPYLAWWLSPDIEIWGTFGLAMGELQVDDDAAFSSQTSEATLASGTVGVNGRLLTFGGTTLRLKGEAGLAQLDVAGSAAAFRNAAVNVQRLRVAAEIEHEEIVENVGVLVPWGELGLRHDGGDGETGFGVEVGAGLHYRQIEQGWNAEVFGRWLVTHDDTLPDEQGLGLRFRYDPEAPGFGPWVSLSQTWGQPVSGLQQLWEDELSDLGVHDPLSGRLDLEVGYGLSAFGGGGTLTPFGALSLGGDDARSYRVGSRLLLGSIGFLSLEAERREYSASPAHHAIMLRGIARY